MRGKYSPTVSAAYSLDQGWWEKNCAPLDDPDMFFEFDRDGYDKYGYNSYGYDRASYQEHEYFHEEDRAFQEVLAEWSFDGTRPVMKSVPKAEDILSKIKNLLHDKLFEGSKDWTQGNVVGRVEWLLGMYKSAKDERDMLSNAFIESAQNFAVLSGLKK